MTENEYRKLKHKINTKRVKELEALELVYEMAKQKWAVRAKSLAKDIRNCLDAIDGEFTIREVRYYLTQQDEDFAQANLCSISGALRRLCDCGQIQIIKRGLGRRATIYAVALSPG